MDRALIEAMDAGVPVVTAFRRQARQVRHLYASHQLAEGVQAWEASPVLSWDDWLVALADEILWSGYQGSRNQRKLLTPLQELTLWQQIIEADNEAPIADLRGTARQARAAWAMLQDWRLPDPLRHPHPSTEIRAFARWMRAYFARTREQGLLDHARLADSIAPALRGGAIAVPSALRLVGFDHFNQQQRTMLKVLEDLGTRLGMTKGPRVDGVARCVRFADTEQEFRAAARWARHLLARQTQDGELGRIAVLVPKLADRRVQLQRIFDDVLLPGSSLPGGQGSGRPYNLAAGPAFPGYPLIATALDIATLLDQPVAGDLLSRLLRSQFLLGGNNEGPLRARFDAWLRHKNVSAVRLEHLPGYFTRFAGKSQTGEADSVLETLLHGLLPLLARATGLLSASQWAELFADVLGVCGWPGPLALSSEEFQTSERFQELLEELASLDSLLPAMEAMDAVALLRRVAAEVHFQPSSPELPIQVLEPEQAYGLHLDNLWICGWHDAAWPAAAAPNPFVPLSWQLDADVPGCSADRQLRAARRLTKGLLRAASGAVISAPLQVDDQPVALSSLVAHLPVVVPAELELEEVTDYHAALHSDGSFETLLDEQAPDLEGIERTITGVGMFRLQAQCPFRACAEIRLGTTPLETARPGLTASQRGQLVHAALEKLWRNVESSDVLAVMLEGEHLEVQLWEVVDAALNKFDQNALQPLPPNYRGLEQQRLVALLRRWLRVEAQRAAFRVQVLEQRASLEIAGCNVKMRFDRLDKLDSGGTAVIDYKTGKASATTWFNERIEEPQLPLYALAQEKPPQAVVIAEVSARNTAFAGVAVAADELPGVKAFADSPAARKLELDWAGLIGRWRERLEAIALEYVAGNARVAPLSGACRYCHLAGACRINEMPVGDETQ